jgi:hypothetical protein
MALRHRFSPGLPLSMKISFVIIDVSVSIRLEILVFWIYKIVNSFSPGIHMFAFDAL